MTTGTGATGSPFTPGTIVDHYTFANRKPLGHGLSGDVYLAHDKRTGVAVAVKAMRYPGADSAQLKAALLELNVLRQISATVRSPHVVRVLDAYQDVAKQILYVVLPLCEGGELFDRIVAKGKFSEDEASQIFRVMVTAILELHQNGIIHRDMKPENVLLRTKDLTNSTDLVITDFGLSALKNTPDMHKLAAVGSPGYMAPEVLQRPPVYTEAVDVWSLGVILYILLSGIPPFYPPNPNDKSRAGQRAMEAKIMRGEFHFFKDYFEAVSADAKDLIQRCLTVDVSRRITMPEILRHPWLTTHQSQENLTSALANLKSFNARRKFRTALMASMMTARMGMVSKMRDISRVAGLEEEEVKLLRTAFLRVAEDGCVNFIQFSTVLKVLGFAHLPMERMFAVMDADGNGTVDYKEFLSGLGRLNRTDAASLRMVFDIYDSDGSGGIDRAEFAKVVYTMYPDLIENDERKADEFLGLFDELDVNGDNEISFEEFKTGIERRPELAAALVQPMSPRGMSHPISERKSPDADATHRYGVARTDSARGRNTTEASTLLAVGGQVETRSAKATAAAVTRAISISPMTAFILPR